jgi:hypothetical protein
MSLKTRGFAAVDKTQRRLALLKFINENLDLGHGLSIEAYTRLIDNTLATLEAHDTLLSNLEEYRKTITQMDNALSELSERMLTGVGTVYGRNSMQYSKVAGFSRKRSTSKKSISQVPSVLAVTTTEPTQTATNGKGNFSNA